MKYIDHSQFDKMSFLQQIRKVSKWFIVFKNMSLGKGVIITKAEWDMKTPPATYCRVLKKSAGMRFKTREL